MLANIKKELLENPEKLKMVLEYFDYCNVVIREGYMSFGRDEYSSKKSIVINLKNNKLLYVTDYARGLNKDLFSFICLQRNLKFADVLNHIKSILGIDDYYDFFTKNYIFGGVYEKIRRKGISSLKIQDESILERYVNLGNARFLKDNISIDAQRYFDIRYDVESQGIVIPIRDQIGQLMGIKIRCNYDVQDGDLKYYYLVPCRMSETLYGYSQNYEYLVDNVIYVFESEKSVMQCYSYGIRNCVALGSGSVSKKQAQMLHELNPKKIVFMHDTGFPLENIRRNINIVKSYIRFSETEYAYWDFFDKDYSDKTSPSDLGKDKLNYILSNELKDYEIYK